MTLGKSPAHADLFRSSAELCEATLGQTSIYRLLHAEGHRLFPDEAFADLFSNRGRRSIPPRIVATVMVLQRFEGLSDREAVEHLTFDLRWKYAAGALDFDHGGFVHTVLVDMRARLRASERPNRIFDAVLEVAKAAGLVGRRRVLDSTALYDAVATQDTVTMTRSAICGVLRVLEPVLAAELRTALSRADDYATPGKPACNWEDASERDALVDALARDGHALLARLDGRTLGPELAEAAKLLATVLGQDLEQREDGIFRIARRVARDRVISTVDPEARHGHKSAARGFDGYKGHVAMGPESEIITATAVSAANVGDGSVAVELNADLLASAPNVAALADAGERAQSEPLSPMPSASSPSTVVATSDSEGESSPSVERAQVYGDASYGTAEVLEKLQSASIEANVKVQAPPTRAGCYSQDAFTVDRQAQSATCPNGVTVKLRVLEGGGAHATFGSHCNECPLRARCTTSSTGRVLTIHPKFETLREARARQSSADWKNDYRATRPKVERKLAHLVRRRHGGRRARVRGRVRVGHDFSMLAAATNLARLAVLGLRHLDGAWASGE